MKADGQIINVDGESLTLEDVLAVVRGGARARVSEAPEVLAHNEEAWRLNNDLIRKGVPVYGVTTGAGESVGHQVAPDRAALM